MSLFLLSWAWALYFPPLPLPPPIPCLSHNMTASELLEVWQGNKSGSGWQRFIRRGLHTLRHSQYQLLVCVLEEAGQQHPTGLAKQIRAFESNGARKKGVGTAWQRLVCLGQQTYP
eukprot:scaffold9538_cov18-Tisochrysis_lutea.AAC.4